MELRGVKKHPLRLWWAIDRRSRQIVGFSLADRDKRTARVLEQQLPKAKYIRYCTDTYKPYQSINAAKQHCVGKAHTQLIESMNNKLRCYLARFGRRTYAYSKSADALLHSLLFVWFRKFGATLQPQTGHLLCKRLWDPNIQIPV